jgi:hypothetical protein
MLHALVVGEIAIRQAQALNWQVWQDRAISLFSLQLDVKKRDKIGEAQDTKKSKSPLLWKQTENSRYGE